MSTMRQSTFAFGQHDGIRPPKYVRFQREEHAIDIYVDDELVGTLDLYYFTEEWDSTKQLQFRVHTRDMDEPALSVHWQRDNLITLFERGALVGFMGSEGPVAVHQLNVDIPLELTKHERLCREAGFMHRQMSGERSWYYDFETVVDTSGEEDHNKHTLYGWTATVELSADESEKVVNVYGQVNASEPDAGWDGSCSIPVDMVDKCLADLRLFAARLCEMGIPAITNGIRLQGMS